MARTVYGRDEIYTRFAWESLDEWRWLSGRSGLPIFHPTGVVFFFGRREPYVDAEHRGASARRHSPGSPRPRGAGEALSTDRVGRRGARSVRARSRRADGAARGTDTGAGVRRSGRRVSPGCDPAAAARRIVRFDPHVRRRDAERDALRVRVRPVAAEGFSGNTRPANFPDAPGSVLLRARSRRRALRACPPARLGGLQQRRHLLRHAGPRSARLQDRARPARAADRSRQRRSHAESASDRRGARIHEAPLSRRSRTGRSSSRACASTRTARTAIS